LGFVNVWAVWHVGKLQGALHPPSNFFIFFNRVITYRKKIIDTRMETSAAGEKIFYPLKQTLYGRAVLSLYQN
jgi:hypothetical protein